MMGPSVVLRISFLLVCLLLQIGMLWGQQGNRDVYVVYMGAVPADSSGNILKESHLQLLASVLQRGQHAEKTLIRSYRHGFSGFAARLSKEEALAIGRKAGVVSVFVDPIYQLHTTRSWDFLQQTMVETDPNPDSDPASSTQASDTIIGILDTGIWPESESFSDEGMGAIPSRWNGTCMKGTDFNASNCNKKLIGARYYKDDGAAATPVGRATSDSPRDELGHGTHTASTAGGNAVVQASYYGLAAGTAKGGSTAARIAMYRVCTFNGCSGSAILAGFDDAIADGVDLLSLSLGASAYFRPDFDEDPIAIGAFHAVAKGITVVCSAGNDGPDAGTVVNAAPWILTVAATTIDRRFESDIVLGGSNKAVSGEAINFSNLEKSPVYPLIYGGSAKSNSSSSDVESASRCELGALDGSKIKGKIVLCKHFHNDSPKMSKIEGLNNSGAVGAILIDDLGVAVATAYVSFPATEVSSQAAEEILTYINSTKNPVATILPTITVTKYKPAPMVAYFSSRGPSPQTSNILKPDIAAPGVNILAAWIPSDSSEVPQGQKSSAFKLVSGTSMACPHVSGIAATIKAWNPTWSPAAIRSAIMTTATQTNNDEASLTTDSGSTATPYDYGAGEVSPTSALQPGLVYEVGTEDYLQFLCNYGYQSSEIKLITTIPDGFECPENSSKDLISNLNYPSITISSLMGNGRKIVDRTVTNVGAEEETTYVASIQSPPGIDVKVTPSKLQFTKNIKKLSYQVIFSAVNSSTKGDLLGSITWSDGTCKVRSPLVVSSN
ncbi:CO(2)-response secreted protease-like [Phoenix dactylifera]|uniref:CO(2)-response secreted protease-like n=1 Tax=Phoenix dactylifera TaxID=42345 RepID=A0A8B7CIT4_PHODC|nr:CO(2)-response secreted protease-like [Phoenix dactylifera]